LAEVPTLGDRGGGWVVLQFALMLAVLAVGALAPGWSEPPLASRAAAAVLLLGSGAALLVLSARELGDGLTPFPKPPAGGRLVQSGPYRLVRHPVYLGGSLIFVGLSLLLSPWSLVASALLVLTWALKSAVEERFLGERHPEYDDYRARTRFRLVPYVY
jgi:protein-S-isoprenylcysteine O-methyltransferase Ste14